jgi:hypothetical protein
MRENNVWKKCLLAISRRSPLARLFRNNNGSGWQGPGFTLKPGQVYRAEGGERVITRPQHIEFGLMPGSGDGIGWESMVITPEMVGRRVAVFLSVETKAGRGRATKDQLNWRQQVHDAGGIAIIVNDPDQIELHLP